MNKFPFDRKPRIFSLLLNWVGSREVSVLLVLLAIVLTLWGFAELADIVDEEITSFDYQLLLSMRTSADHSDPLGPQWMEEVGRDITALGGNAILIMITLVAIGYLILEKKPRLALVLLIATVGALGASQILKNFYDRDRPDLVTHSVVVYSQSFPSGHSMLSASTYLTLGALVSRAQRRKRVKFYIMSVAVTTTLLVGLSRIYLGVHWPTDVLAGWTAGTGWALICWLLARWLQYRGDIENTPIDSSGAQ